MIYRPLPIFCFATLALALIAAPTFPARAQATAPMDASSSNAAPAPPSSPATTTPPEQPAAPPAATAPPATPDTGTASGERPTSYTVVEHDSLWAIAKKFDTSVTKLRKANHLKKHALLHPGQVLQIPPASSDTSTK